MRAAGRGQRCALASNEDDADVWGFARDADGLFTPLPEDPGARRMRLAGCRPEGGLRRSADRVGTRCAVAGSADLAILDATGVAMGSYVVNEVTVVDVRPSAHGAGLVDLVVTLWCDSAMPGADGVWELIRTGRLDRTGLWRELAPQDRRAWLSVALLSHEYRRRGRADTPAGRVVTLDGRHIEDRDSFFCAMGEAVNGPGGYWGWNLDALVDCLRGRWGATPPFTLQWADSAGARARLVEQVPTDGGPVLLFDLLVDILEERGTHVLLQ